MWHAKTCNKRSNETPISDQWSILKIDNFQKWTKLLTCWEVTITRRKAVGDSTVYICFEQNKNCHVNPIKINLTRKTPKFFLIIFQVAAICGFNANFYLSQNKKRIHNGAFFLQWMVVWSMRRSRTQWSLHLKLQWVWWNPMADLVPYDFLGSNCDED